MAYRPLSFIFTENPLLVNKPLHNVAILVDATVAKEWPPTAHILTMFQVYLNNDTFFLVRRRAIEHFALRTNNH